MTDKHPITPPPELVRQWLLEYYGGDLGEIGPDEMYLAKCGAQWGADQELEACVEWFRQQGYDISVHKDLRFARRPKPPSLKEQALELARPAEAKGAYVTFGPDELATIRRALEQLPND